MSQDERIQAADKAPRTQIEDLSAPGEELSEEEASSASGGMVIIRGSWETGATQYPNTCTAGNALDPHPDTDYGNDY
jgi:hypothetical protein